MATSTDKAKDEAQRTKPADEVETKSQADAKDDKTDVSRADARDSIRKRRAREFRRVEIVPGAAGDPVEPSGEVDAGIDYDDDAVVTLDENVDAPSTSAPGSGPFDTQDPLEHASSVTPDKGAAARAGMGTVNAVVPIPDPSGAEWAEESRVMGRGKHRMERYPVRGPDGREVMVEHNIDTGETKVLSTS